MQPCQWLAMCAVLYMQDVAVRRMTGWQECTLTGSPRRSCVRMAAPEACRSAPSLPACADIPKHHHPHNARGARSASQQGVCFKCGYQCIAGCRTDMSSCGMTSALLLCVGPPFSSCPCSQGPPAAEAKAAQRLCNTCHCRYLSAPPTAWISDPMMTIQSCSPPSPRVSGLCHPAGRAEDGLECSPAM